MPVVPDEDTRKRWNIQMPLVNTIRDFSTHFHAEVYSVVLSGDKGGIMAGRHFYGVEF